MKIIRKPVAVLWVSCLMVFAANTWAYPVKWTLENFVFEDGGVAEGSFVLEGYTDFSDVQITSSSTSTRRGANYATTFGSFDPYYREFSPLGAITEGTSVLSIYWYPRALGAGPGIVDVEFLEGACSGLNTDPGGDKNCSSYSPARLGLPGARLVGVGSDKVNVPEPDIAILMGLGLAGIAFARISRKQHQRKTANPA